MNNVMTREMVKKDRMTREEIEDVLAAHEAWLTDSATGERADLSYADLHQIDLHGVDLSYAHLYHADLSRADLSGAKLSHTDLSEAKLVAANLQGADLSEAKLVAANLHHADLSDADLSSADLSEVNLDHAKLIRSDLSQSDLFHANLDHADLSEANLDRTELTGANMDYANLSGARNLLSASDWLAENFQATADGVIVYMAIGREKYATPDYWDAAPGAYLTEVVNPCRTIRRGCGVNFGTLEYCQRIYPQADHWRCLIAWRDLADTVVPYDTGGQARCGRLQLLERV